MSEHLIDQRVERAAEPEAVRAVQRRASPWRLAAQAVGFIAGLGLLAWAIVAAFGPEENRAQLARLGQAPWWEVAALLGLNAATLVINGLIFWLVIRPERRLDAGGVLATNAIASFLSLLPFKISLLARLAVHTRRDRLPILMIMGWLAAFGVTLAIVFGPVVGASLGRERVDAAWWGVVVGGVVALLALTVGVSRALAGRRGLERLHRLLDPLARGPLRPMLRSTAFANLHAVFGMLAHPGTVSLAILLRCADFAVQVGRFVTAGAVLGIALGWEDAILITATYYAIGAVSPSGNLGTREAGTIALAQGLDLAAGGSAGGNPIAVIVLLVTASETLVNLVGAIAGGAWIRLDRILTGRSPTPTPATPDPALDAGRGEPGAGDR